MSGRIVVARLQHEGAAELAVSLFSDAGRQFVAIQFHEPFSFYSDPWPSYRCCSFSVTLLDSMISALQAAKAEIERGGT